MSDALEFFFKPSGLSTHETESKQANGFLEFLQQKISPEIKLAHRLDKGTSGVMVGARDLSALTEAIHAFENQSVKKTYLFVTDQACLQEQWSVKSWISKKSSGIYQSELIEISSGYENVSDHAKPSIPSHNGSQLALTHFKKIKTVGPWSLIEAQPQTGRTHQIRLHALQSKIPILGDTTYGGSTFFRLMLHAEHLTLTTSQFSKDGHCERPIFFENLEYLSDEMLCRWLDAVDRRRYLFADIFQQPSSLRLLHTEADPLRADLLGHHIWAGWWADDPPSARDLQRIELFKAAVSKMFSYPVTFSLQMRANREADKELSQRKWFDTPESDWVTQEQHCQFWMRADAGLSPGLFLDQRQNRSMIGSLSQNKSVLNLFSYTGGFSVVAALGGARQVTTVDTSKAYIEWSKQNFQLNQIDQNRHTFWAFDVLDFLELKAKKQEKFDVIVCDPPSFGRSPRGVFKLEKDFGFLLEKIARVLSPGGCLLFSCNFEKWSNEEFKDHMNKTARTHKWKVIDFPLGWPDFELDRKQTVLKSVLFRS